MKNLSKKVWIPLCVILACIVVGVVIFVSLYFTVLKVNLKINATQVGEEQKVLVEWDTSKVVDKVSITVSHNGDKVFSVSIYDNSQILKGEYEVPCYYGRQTVKVSINKGVYSTSKIKTVNVFASEYNIAPLTATMPVTLFSLSLKTITNEYTIPTFVWLKRAAAWDYTNLPNNVYIMPNASAQEVSTETSQRTMYKKTSEWIKELYEINPSSHFNLYYNDYYPYGWLQATVANGIPEENYDVTLLSDGTASFLYFNNHFDNANAQSEYEKMKQEYSTLKSQIEKKGEYAERMDGFAIDAEDLREYAYVMAKEEANVQWWLTRIDGTLAPNNAEMKAEVDSLKDTKIFVKDLNTLINTFDEQEKQELKKLYKFSDNMFEKATEENKKIMIILGTWTQNEYYFDAYVKAVQAYYGDEYVYYYKGHPKNPTNSVDGKLEKLEKLNLIDVDSTIPAELIFFFNPEAFAAGYQSTTFVSLNEEKCTALFNVRIDAFTESYKDKLDVFITPVQSTDSVYGSLVSGDNCYVLEFVDTTNYSIAIYDASKNTIKYYAKQNESFVEVDA